MMDLQAAAAFNCYVSTGFKPDQSIVDNCTLSIAKGQGFLENIALTEAYIYDECMFSTHLIIEAHVLYEFIQYIITVTETAAGKEINCGPDEIKASLLSLGYEISLELLNVLGINPALSEEEFNEFAMTRVNQYAPLLLESVSNQDVLSVGQFGIGVLDQRNHPLKKYLGTISDNMINSLGRENISAVEEPIFQSCLWTRHASFLQAIQQKLT